MKALEPTVTRDDARLKFSFDVECKKVTKTFTVFADEGVEVLKEKVQTAFKLTSQPSLKLGEKDISNEWLKEEAIRSDDSIRSGDTKRITLNCEIFTPWDISASDESGINYKRLVDEFGVELVTDEIVSRVERLTNRSAHPWLRRKFFFSHRGFDKILDTVEAGDTYYLYTGRGPSSTSLHLGHMIQFMFAKYLQEAFGVVLVIQMSDDEKFLFKKDLSLDEVKKMAFDNARDIVALGFDPTRTYIFSDISEIGSMYECVLQLLKNTPAHLEEMIFGFNGHSPAGFYMWPCVQAAPAFSCTFPEIFGPPRYDIATNQYFGPTEPINKKKEKEKDSKNKKKKDKKKDTKEGDQQSNEQPQSEWAIPCLIPCAIDQDPYFRMCRDLASGIGHPPPCTLLSRFVPGFSGVGTKMSASVQHDTTSSSSGSQNKQKEKVIPQTVFMNDNLKIIKLAVNSAFSIGANTLKEQEETGTADKHIELDVAFQYLKIFDLETNDKVLERVGNIYLYGKQLYEIERIEKKEEDKQIDSQQQKIPWGNQSQESIDQFLSEYRGSVTVGMLKLRLIDVLHEMTQKHQNARSKVTDEDVRKFMSRRRMIGNRIIRNEQNEEMKEEKQEIVKTDQEQTQEQVKEKEQKQEQIKEQQNKKNKEGKGKGKTNESEKIIKQTTKEQTPGKEGIIKPEQNEEFISNQTNIARNAVIGVGQLNNQEEINNIRIVSQLAENDQTHGILRDVIRQLDKDIVESKDEIKDGQQIQLKDNLLLNEMRRLAQYTIETKKDKQKQQQLDSKEDNNIQKDFSIAILLIKRKDQMNKDHIQEHLNRIQNYIKQQIIILQQLIDQNGDIILDQKERLQQFDILQVRRAILAVVHLSGNKGSLQVLADEKIHLDLIEITFILSRVKQLDQFEHIFGASLLGLASLGLNQKVQKDYEEQRRRILIISERVLQLASQRNIINNDKNRQDQENSITDELNDEECFQFLKIRNEFVASASLDLVQLSTNTTIIKQILQRNEDQDQDRQLIQSLLLLIIKISGGDGIGMNNNQIQLKVKEQSGDKNKGGDDTITVRRRCLDIIRTLIEEKIQGISDVNVVIRFLMSQQSSHSNYIVSLINSVSTVEHNRQALIGGLDGIETLHRMLRAKAMIQNQASLINQTETNKDQEINEHERILHELTITMLEQGEKEEIDAQMFNYFVREPKAGVNQALRRLGKELELLPTA